MVCSSGANGRRRMNRRPAGSLPGFGGDQRRFFQASLAGKRHDAQHQDQHGGEQSKSGSTIERRAPVAKVDEEPGCNAATSNGSYALGGIEKAIVGGSVRGAVVVANDGWEEREHAAPGEVNQNHHENKPSAG